ncbi:kinetochore scaffold 1 [Apus apus]|uniref:kinetochore scaffold 1 n=1 Tax=Apus apus TaxID=8895 RepID=UPI0021F83ADE|nr:kinetochore scaffold 1 [Apus apus]
MGKAHPSEMDKNYPDPNMENDNTEHIRVKRLSSILKAPRHPFDELGNGNELTQDIHAEKRRKNSRRVSFADTINCRVFPRDLKNNTSERENTEGAGDTGNDVFHNQNEDSEAVPCEITGMNTLLHAPIQALVQQTEWQEADKAVQRANRHDTTLLFSEGNEMDMTASHTAVIARNLKNSQADPTEKVDISSFLAGLNPSHGKAEDSQGFRFFSDPTNHSCPSLEQKEDATAVKKIDFNQFLMSLKSNKPAPHPAEGPEKENVFFVPSQAAAPAEVGSAYSHEPLDTCNVTKVFREQEDGMEMTQCQGAALAGAWEAPAELLPCADVTQAFGDDGMDMTTSHTAKVSFPFSSAGNQSLNLKKDLPSTDNSALKRAPNQHLIAQQDPQVCADKEPVTLEDRRDPTVLRAAKQEARARSAIPGSISSETVFRGDKAVVCSKYDDMEITGNYTDIICNDGAKETSSSHHRTCEKPVNANSVLAETRRSAHGARDTTSLTSSDLPASVAYKNSASEPPSGSDESGEKVTRDHRTASANVGFHPHTHSVSVGVSQSRLQPSLANSQLGSLPGEKTVIFSGEDMDLTKTCVVKDEGEDVENQPPAGVVTSVTCKPRFLDGRSTSPSVKEQEEMEITKCHAVVIDDQSKGGTAEAKQMLCKLIPGMNQNTNVREGTNPLDMEKENLEVTIVDRNSRRSLVMEKNYKERTQNASVSCTNNKMGMFPGDPNMDITTTHPAPSDVAAIHRVQDYKSNYNQHTVTSKQLQHQTLQFASVGITSQAAATECGDLKMSTNEQTVHPLASNGPFIASNKPAPSGMKGNEQPGTMLGINAGCQNSDRQEKTHAMKVLSKVLPTRVGSEGDLFMGKADSSEEDATNPPSLGGLHWRAAGEPLAAQRSEAQKRSSQLPSCLEKSVVFPSGENMDLTGNCAVMVPDHTSTALSERKAAPGHLVQDENTIMSLKKGITITSQEQAECHMHSLVSGKKMLTMTGLTHLPFAGEKTTIFSEDADMDITKSHTVSAENKIILQCKNSNDDTPLISGDKTCIFTFNDDMEISRLDTVATAKSLAKAASHRMLGMAERTGRKSLKGEKTVLFSLSDDNNDMEITESHTAAIGHEVVSQKEGGPHTGSSAHPLRTVMVTSSQADTDTTRPCSADRTATKVVCDAKPNLAQEAGWGALADGNATTLALDEMELTRPQAAALEGRSLQGRQPHCSAPLTATIMFTSYQADMEMTQADMEMTQADSAERTERVLCEERLNLGQQVGLEAVPGNKTVIFTVAEDMEMTTAQTAAPRCAVPVQDRQPIPALPADKTLVFNPSHDDMEITASHTVAVNDNVNGLENQEVSSKGTQQPGLRGASLSSCRAEIDSPHTQDLNGDCPAKSVDKSSIPHSAPSATALGRDRGKGATQDPSGTPPDSMCSVLPPEETMDVQAPQGPALPRAHSVPLNSQQVLLPPENLSAKSVSYKLPRNGPTDCGEERGDLVSHVLLPSEQPGSLMGPPDACGAWRDQGLKDGPSRHEDLAADFSLAGANLVPAPNMESEENEGLSAEGEAPPKDFHINSEQTKQLVVSDNPRDEIDPALSPEVSGILKIYSKLKNMRRKSAVFSVSETALSDQLPKPPAQPEDTLRLGKNTVNEPNNFPSSKDQENTCLEPGAAPIGANLGIAIKDKYQGINIPLGFFQPKLPSRRNPPVSSAQDTNAQSSDKEGAPVSEVRAHAGEIPGGHKPGRQNFSPSQFIAEEFLPVCLDEMDSNESVSTELVENAGNEISKPQISHNGKNLLEETKTYSNTKRALEEDEEDLQSPKKPRRDETLDGEASQDLQVTSGAVSQSQVEVHGGEDPPNVSAKSPDSTHASNSSSLDSVKADTKLTTQPSSQLESQLLTDSVCEDTLREKLQDGVITVGEFFTLLEVHVPIQKPRHSHVPVICAASAAPTPADLLYSHYVYRPKLRIYEEDCQALAQKIEELKPYANVQDQLLVNVNRSFWEVMRTCSDEELKNFGAELNKMKSCFIKESKILAHEEKATLYSRLLQSAQEQHEKLQSRMEKLGELLEEAESCFGALEADSDREEWEADSTGEMAEGKNLQEELESLKAQEEELQRELADLEAENEQMLVQMNLLKEREKSCQEHLEKYDFMEWELTEWSQQQAVFSFLYDALELTVVFGPPIDGDVFGEDPSRKIVSLSFESLLDEENAPPSSCLVQRLIFQFIESQGCWQEKCPTLYHLPQVLQDISLVVSRCKILGEEIEFLERWGGKFNLLKTDISDTTVKLLFSASTAFAKFELTLSLSASYPSDSLPFTVHKQIGNIGEEEISAVLCRVPLGHHYLRRAVSLIHQHLLQPPR